jgi:hypothetical protein
MDTIKCCCKIRSVGFDITSFVTRASPAGSERDETFASIVWGLKCPDFDIVRFLLSDLQCNGIGNYDSLSPPHN